MFSAVHQILPTLNFGDAVGNQALRLRALLRQWGYASEIFAEAWDERRAADCHLYTRYRRFSHANNLLIFHFSIGSQLPDFLRGLPDHIVVYYHNITPAHFFYRYNGALARLLEEGRQQLSALAKSYPAIAGSEFNAQELRALGFVVVGLTPYTLSLEHSIVPASSAPLDPRFVKTDTLDWLYVGRLAPNKCIQDLLQAFYFYHYWINRRSRLMLVGPAHVFREYVNELYALVTHLDLDGAVVFTSLVEDPAPFYQQSDVFITLSEHEGFCVLLVEAMQYELPILAFASTAIPETLGRSGVLIREKNFPLIAEMVHEVTTNVELRRKLIQTQHQRRQELFTLDAAVEFRRLLSTLEGRWAL